MKPYVLVAAGHSDKDPGAVYSGIREEDLMTELRDLVLDCLEAKGVHALSDGADGFNLPLADSKKLAAGARLAIELHTNAAANPAATGVEVLARPEKAAEAAALAAAISKALGLPLRGAAGWKSAAESARGRLGFVDAGGLVVEVFFLSNPKDFEAYKANRAELAEALADKIGELCA